MFIKMKKAKTCVRHAQLVSVPRLVAQVALLNVSVQLVRMKIQMVDAWTVHLENNVMVARIKIRHAIAPLEGLVLPLGIDIIAQLDLVQEANKLFCEGIEL
jgi:hypothetical protein